VQATPASARARTPATAPPTASTTRPHLHLHRAPSPKTTQNAAVSSERRVAYHAATKAASPAPSPSPPPPPLQAEVSGSTVHTHTTGTTSITGRRVAHMVSHLKSPVKTVRTQ
jgi:hypothetical protein